MDEPARSMTATEKGREKAIKRLVNTMGLTLSHQQKIGAFLVYAGTFERHLEMAAWAATEIPTKPGEQPFTDKMQISGIIKKIRGRERGKGGSLGKAIDLCCDAADDLLAYRNAIAHGWLFPGTTAEPRFLNNFAWHNEKRGRPPQSAHITEELLDMAVDSAYILSASALDIWRCCSGIGAFDPNHMASHIPRLERAKSQAESLKNYAVVVPE